MAQTGLKSIHMGHLALKGAPLENPVFYSMFFVVLGCHMIPVVVRVRNGERGVVAK
jgi:heme/copper-type cytochrome/quinol oxidase subunit 3